MNKKQKPFRIHLGVKIYRVKEQIPGSDLRELKDGTMVPCKPQYEIFYQYPGAYKYDSLTECIQAINKVKQNLEAINSYDPAVFVETMNSGEW